MNLQPQGADTWPKASGPSPAISDDADPVRLNRAMVVFLGIASTP